MLGGGAGLKRSNVLSDILKDTNRRRAVRDKLSGPTQPTVELVVVRSGVAKEGAILFGLSHLRCRGVTHLTRITSDDSLVWAVWVNKNLEVSLARSGVSRRVERLGSWLVAGRKLTLVEEGVVGLAQANELVPHSWVHDQQVWLNKQLLVHLQEKGVDALKGKRLVGSSGGPGFNNRLPVAVRATCAAINLSKLCFVKQCVCHTKETSFAVRKLCARSSD